MSTLSLRDFGLAPAQVRAVEKRARQQGKSPSEYVRALVERDLIAGSFDEVLRPIRAGFAKGGVSAGELDAIVSRARKATRPRPKRAPRK
jgi:hypothetical protein